MPTAVRKPQDHLAKAVKPEPDPRGKVEGRTFVWTDEDGMTLTIPLRIRMAVLRSMSDDNLDAAGMFAMIEAIAPDQTEIIDEMDVNSFTSAFTAWQSAYNAQAGASLGESSASSA